VGVSLLFLLAGLAAGLFPDVLYSPKWSNPAGPLPTLGALAVAQSAFFLLGWPIVLLWRSEHRSRLSPLGLAGQIACMILASLPLYGLAAWLADARPADVVRTLLEVLALVPLGLAGGFWLTHRPTRSLALTALAGLTVGLPMAWYIVFDFLPALPSDWLWQLAPLLRVYSAATEPATGPLPRPLWTWLILPGVGTLLLIVEELLLGQVRRR
jgi:hypothetical protein